MYKWKIVMILKSGKEVLAYYKGDECNSVQVGDKLFAGEGNAIIGLNNYNDTESIYILRSEIATMAISAV